MHGAVDLFGQRAVDARHLGDLFDARATNTAQPAEMGEQFPAPFRPDAGYLFEFGLLTLLLPSLPVPGDGESVCFVADVLEQVRALNALSRIEADRGWYLESGYIEGSKSRAIRSEVETLCREVAQDSELLTAGFGIPDALLPGIARTG